MSESTFNQTVYTVGCGYPYWWILGLWNIYHVFFSPDSHVIYLLLHINSLNLTQIDTARSTICKLCNSNVEQNIMYSKTVSWLSPIHRKRNELCFIYLLIYFCTILTSSANILNEHTVRSEGIQLTLYFIMSAISLVWHCCLY